MIPFQTSSELEVVLAVRRARCCRIAGKRLPEPPGINPIEAQSLLVPVSYRHKSAMEGSGTGRHCREELQLPKYAPEVVNAAYNIHSGLQLQVSSTEEST